MPYANLNLEGRVVSDPEFKQGKDQQEFCIIRVVVNEWRGGQEQAVFYNCLGNEAMCHRVRKAGLKKGRMIHVVGDFFPREYKSKDGQMKMSLDLSMLNWQYVGSKPKEESTGSAPTAAPVAGNAQQAGTVHEEQYIGADDDELPL